MRSKLCLLAFLAASTLPAFAQPAVPLDRADCPAEEASLQQDIALARSRGQMLRRRQLMETLQKVQEQCAALVPVKDQASRIRRQEQEVAQLRLELERAEAYLNKLKAEVP
jgi:Protein of unknown function (DUF1090)